MDHNVKRLLDIIEKNNFDKKVMFDDNEDFQALYRIIRRSLKMNTILEKNLQHINENLKEQVAKEVEENRKKEQMLLQQSKLAIMGEMISMIAHQWRQPLSSIKVISQSMKLKKQMNVLTDDILDNSIDDIVKLSDYMNNTIDDFRNFFKPSKDSEIVEVAELLESSISFVQHSLENNGIALETSYKDGVFVNIYKGEFTQVVINILNNAKDVLIENNIENPCIKVSMEFFEDDVKILILDNGGGIPDDIIDKVFDPYFSTKGKNGTGIGLYMSKTIVDEHLDGMLSVYNEDNGAMFNIDLPIYKIDKK
jgi:signal transduction histidine kinase